MATSRAVQDISRALVQAANDNACVSAVVASLIEVEEALRLQPDLLMNLVENVVPLKTRHIALREAWQSAVHPLVLNALLVLQEQDLLQEVSTFLHIVITDAREIARHYEVTVRSVEPLRDKDRTELEAALQQRFGGTQRVHEQIDKTILGGLLLEIGHWQLDVSLKGTIERLNHCLIT